jgi:predicted nucleic acid-binding Zn ribbon protein
MPPRRRHSSHVVRLTSVVSSPIHLCPNCRYPITEADATCSECGCDGERRRVLRLRRLWRNDIVLLLALAFPPLLWFGCEPVSREVKSALARLRDPWPVYSEARAAHAKSQAQGLVLYFDAEWVLLGCGTASFEAARNQLPSQARQLGLVPLRVDLADPADSGASLYSSLGLVGIPLFVVLDSQGNILSVSERPEVAVQALTALASQRVK